MPKARIVSDVTLTGNVIWNNLTGFGISLDANKSYEISGLIGVTTENNPSYGSLNLQLQYTGTSSIAVANEVEEVKFNQNTFNAGLFSDGVGVFTTNRQSHETWAKIGGIIKTTALGDITIEGKISDATIKGIILKDSYLEFTEIV